MGLTGRLGEHAKNSVGAGIKAPVAIHKNAGALVERRLNFREAVVGRGAKLDGILSELAPALNPALAEFAVAIKKEDRLRGDVME
jgi:hypothetical protein